MSNRIPVSTRALLARVNRHLRKKNEIIRRCKTNNKFYHELGDFYGVDVYSNFITTKHIDLGEWAKDLGVIKPFEIWKSE